MTRRRPGEPARGNRGAGRPGDNRRRPAARGAARPATGARPLADGAAGGSGGPREAHGSGAAEPSRRRPRFTGRMAVLTLVLLVLLMSYASSMKAYLQQRAHLDALHAQIAQQQARIEVLQREKQRWDDPAYVRTQARERFGYVLPGEQSFVVVDGDGQPLDPEASLGDPADVEAPPTAWWDSAWASVELAGNPPKDQAPPDTTIRDGDAG
ncbi:septum formation initiator family protein [Nocardioides sp.]|uniref:FtsB family cell division protein n=1 Tax=Nocardioides sp. TaxID=35761 RepID=UPI00352787D1